MSSRLFSKLKKYSEHTTTILFVLGFIFDMVMLPDIEHAATRYIGAAYLCAIALSIMFREWVVSFNTASNFEQKVYSLTTFAISFCSGSALSFILVYSIRSADFLVSWPLLVMLLLCIAANEFVSTHNFRFNLDVGVLLIATVFYTIFNVPVLFKIQNDKIFGISIIVAMVISFIYIYFLGFTSENAKYERSRGYALSLGVPMFVGMLYFLNIIPAVPLTLKDSGVYHNIIRNEKSVFIAQTEVDDSFFSKFKTATYHINDNDNGVYFFSAVGAPGELTAPLSHTWEYYDTSLNKWVPVTTISFTLAGGREDGYRAYSQKENINEGLWRVTVKVDNNRVVGQLRFKVIKTNDRIDTRQKYL